MSRGAQAEFIRERVAGKWQIPLLLVSLALLGGALLQIEPPQAKIPFDTLVERISAAIDGRMYSLAISDARQLLAYLEQEEREDVGDAGRVQLLLARALSLRAQEQRPDAGGGRELLDAYHLASQAGQDRLRERGPGQRMARAVRGCGGRLRAGGTRGRPATPGTAPACSGVEASSAETAGGGAARGGGRVPGPGP